MSSIDAASPTHANHNRVSRERKLMSHVVALYTLQGRQLSNLRQKYERTR
jgi:hypothetical protein